MKIHDCLKGFTRGVSKVCPPEQTCKSVLRKLKNSDPQILAGYFEVLSPSTIPQYRVRGTDYYGQVIKLFLDNVPGSKGFGANGKGHSKEQALASGLMELVERYSCCKYILNNRAPSKVYSLKELKKDNQFQLEHLYANVCDEDQVRMLEDAQIRKARIRWCDGYSLQGNAVRLPMHLIMMLVEGTNGMAAGNSLEEALLHAICEVIERHCESRIELNKLKTPRIDPGTIDFPVVKGLMSKFHALNQQVFLKDFSLGIGFPVIGVVRIIDKSNCMISSGVATTREEALIRALTENSQAEGKLNFKRIDASRHYFAHERSISMRDIPNIDDKNMRVELENIEKILHRQNMKVFYVDTTDKTLKIPSVIVYVSGTKMLPLRKNISEQRISMFLISVCLDTENYVDLERHLAKAVKNKYIGLPEYFYLKGVVLKRRSHYKKAILFLSRSARAAGHEPAGTEGFNLRVKSMVNIGLCYQALNDPRTAIDWYLKTVDLSPDFSIEDLQFFYDNIRLLSKDRGLFAAARDLYRELKLLRARLPAMPRGEFRSMFYAYQKNKRGIRRN
jgi:ribosomal protein S12 methylthiotransferase accessory factor